MKKGSKKGEIYCFLSSVYIAIPSAPDVCVTWKTWLLTATVYATLSDFGARLLSRKKQPIAHYEATRSDQLLYDAVHKHKFDLSVVQSDLL